MVRVRTVEVPHSLGQRVCVRGWLQSLRRLGGISFIVVRDGFGTVQAVAERDEELGPLATAGVGAESIVTIEGRVVGMPQAPLGVELHDLVVQVEVPVADLPPVQLGKKVVKAGLNVLLDHAVVANRHPTRRALFRLGAAAMAGFRGALDARSFTEIQSPKIVAAATESGANVFKLGYFGTPAFLAQSPQLYKQIMVGVFERVYEVGPVFRAEPHDTPRHINEYVSLDAELGFIEDHTTVMALLREVLAGILARMGETCTADLALLGVALPEVPASIPAVHFSEALELAFRETGVDNRHEPDLAPQDERALGEWARREHQSDFLFVTGYPMRKRPFYTHPDPARPESSNSFDLLFCGTELVTGGQRLHRYDDYLAALAKAGLSVEPFTSYLEAFRFGMPPHGGFAIGLERLIMQLTGVPNIRLATLFPRDLGRLVP